VNEIKLTKAKKDAMVEMFRRGAPVGVVCDKLGIGRGTYYLWKKKAENYHPADKDSRVHRKYFELFQLIDEARSEAFQSLVAEIYRMGIGYETEETVEEYEIVKGKTSEEGKVRKTTKFVRHPQALIFLAERLFPAYLGNRMKLDIDGINELFFRTFGGASGRGEGEFTQALPGEGDGTAEKALSPARGPREPEDWEELPA